MKLGKALATGVAQERPHNHDEERGLADELAEIEPAEAPAPEGAPATR